MWWLVQDTIGSNVKVHFFFEENITTHIANKTGGPIDIPSATAQYPATVTLLNVNNRLKMAVKCSAQYAPLRCEQLSSSPYNSFSRSNAHYA